MNPAVSVILLTVLIGAGQGLFLALFTAQACALFGLLPAQDGHGFYAAGAIVCLVFLGAGLFASFFHLGRPERAWRSAAQWRTSWLSREVIVLPTFMVTVLLYAVAQRFDWRPAVATLPGGVVIDATLVLGALGSALALALFLCTGMIYACLRFLREWHSPLTVINFTLLGAASGYTLAAALAAGAAPDLAGAFAVCSTIITALACASHLVALSRNARLKPKSSLQSAIGIKHPLIRQTAMGFMGGSFNTREFFHRARRPALQAVKALSLAGSFALPVALLLGGAPLPAFIVQCCGLLAERWLFFARANHPQNLYYQEVVA